MDKLSNDLCQLRTVLMSCKMDSPSHPCLPIVFYYKKSFFIFHSGLTPTQTFCALILLLQIDKSQNWKLTWEHAVYVQSNKKTRFYCLYSWGFSFWNCKKTAALHFHSLLKMGLIPKNCFLIKSNMYIFKNGRIYLC